ncbi:MAG: polyphenol oxidase family protein [Solirubrobacteraceae bacterium]
MQPPAPFYELADHLAVELPGARAVFTTRRGGGSSGPYASLNLGFSTDDDSDSAARNRATLLASVGAPPAAFMYQTHSAKVRVLDQPAQAYERVRVDGQATALAGIAPAALGADCLPIAIAGGGAVAVVHAGWRGLAGGVIAAGVRAVRDLAGDDSAELGAAIGPGAGPCCYEVGPEVHARFSGYQTARGDNLDLKAIAAAQLEAAGVAAVQDLGMCTICAPSLFYSHRRDAGVTGRQAGLAWLT